MKYLYLFLIIILQVSCNANKTINSEITAKPNDSLCPKDGVCSFEIVKNKSFEIKKDEFKSTYLDLKDSDKIILKFEYTRNLITDTQDSSYIEQVFIEIDKNPEDIDLKDLSLENVKASFARLCFCRGQTGYYSIKSGDLSIKKLKDELFVFKLNFKINEVPQVIYSIEERLSL